jgi:hypothetical protein
LVSRLSRRTHASCTERFTFRKEVKPKMVGLTLGGADSGNSPITLGEW